MKYYKLVYGNGEWGMANPDGLFMPCWKNPLFPDGSDRVCSNRCPMFSVNPIDLNEDFQTHEQVVLHCAPTDIVIHDCELVKPLISTSGTSGKKGE